MIIPLLRIIFNSSTAVFEKTINSYNGDFTWTKDGVLSFFKNSSRRIEYNS
ncbi:MAG: hypothetical protein P8I02_04810 [Flavobacteriales bacterium]|nr:hypothetical protein [Flavobacteriales bacterium]